MPLLSWQYSQCDMSSTTSKIFGLHAVFSCLFCHVCMCAKVLKNTVDADPLV